jgi:hypothetical protein
MTLTSTAQFSTMALISANGWLETVMICGEGEIDMLCPHCGTLCAEGELFCSACGNLLQSMPNSAISSSQNPASTSPVNPDQQRLDQPIPTPPQSILPLKPMPQLAQVSDFSDEDLAEDLGSPTGITANDGETTAGHAITISNAGISHAATPNSSGTNANDANHAALSPVTSNAFAPNAASDPTYSPTAGKNASGPAINSDIDSNAAFEGLAGTTNTASKANPDTDEPIAKHKDPAMGSPATPVSQLSKHKSSIIITIIAILAAIATICSAVFMITGYQERRHAEDIASQTSDGSNASSGASSDDQENSGSSSDKSSGKSSESSSKGSTSTKNPKASNAFDATALNAIVAKDAGDIPAAVAVRGIGGSASYSSPEADSSFTAWGLVLPLYLNYMSHTTKPSDSVGEMMRSLNNDAANTVLDKAGGLDGLNAWLKRQHYDGTSFGRTFGDVAAKAEGHDNTVSADDAADMLAKVAQEDGDSLMSYNLAADGIGIPAGATIHAHHGTDGADGAHNYFIVMSYDSHKVAVSVMVQGDKATAAKLTSDVLAEVWDTSFTN